MPRARTGGIAPNDILQLDEMEIEEDTAEIEFEGVGETEGRDTVIKLVGIRNLDDFKKAFDRAFARGPLQEEHPDWPADVRKAIGERKLAKGMTKRQVFYISGSPESFEEREEKGKKVPLRGGTGREDKPSRALRFQRRGKSFSPPESPFRPAVFVRTVDEWAFRPSGHPSAVAAPGDRPAGSAQRPLDHRGNLRHRGIAPSE